LKGVERLVLVGDHCQLPPSVMSLEAETRGLSLSVFSRLVAQGIPPHFLDTQFRMHPEIASYSAQRFYHGQLKTGVKPEDRPAPLGFDWPVPNIGVAFVSATGRETRDGESWANSGEVNELADVITKVLAAGELSVLDIGVVTPYAGQVRALREKLRNELPRRLRGTDVDLTGGLQGRQAQRALEIASVDAYQGREKQLIIFSAVRSNSYGNVGFLADWRRLNVMVTRAKRGLIIIGNMKTLRADETWGGWIDWAAQSGYLIGDNSLRKELAAEPAPARTETPLDALKETVSEHKAERDLAMEGELVEDGSSPPRQPGSSSGSRAPTRLPPEPTLPSGKGFISSPQKPTLPPQGKLVEDGSSPPRQPSSSSGSPAPTRLTTESKQRETLSFLDSLPPMPTLPPEDGEVVASAELRDYGDDPRSQARTSKGKSAGKGADKGAGKGVKGGGDVTYY